MSPALLQHLGNGVDGTDAHLFRQAAGNGIGHQAAEGANAQLAGPAGFHQNDRRRAIGGLRGVARSHRSLSVKGRLELGKCFELKYQRGGLRRRKKLSP